MSAPTGVTSATIDLAPARTSDAGELWTLQLAAYLSEARLHETFDIPPLQETLEELRAAVGRGPMLKAMLGTRIVGAVRGRAEGRTGHIGRLAVAPDLQGRGIGTRLVLAIEALLADDVDRFELFTGPRSTANVRLYERLGYQLIPTPPGGAPAVFLAKAAR
jgi:ribosomal protein S18 acetylase RimI-like enzyme